MKEENTTTNPIVGNKATELAMEVWGYIFALENSVKKTLRDDNNKDLAEKANSRYNASINS